jgi:hypothetical protein
MGSVAVAAAAALAGCCGPPRSDSTAAADTTAEVRVSTRSPEEIVRDIRIGNTGAAYPDNARMMAELLEVWNPVGRQTDELIRLVGVPTRTSDRVLLYSFEDGYNGLAWKFHLDDGLVSGVERVSLR